MGRHCATAGGIKNQIRQNRTRCMVRGDDGRVCCPIELPTLRRSIWRARAETPQAEALLGITSERQRRKLYLSLDQMTVAFGLAMPLRESA
jgi:hypothetical protein